MHVNKKGSILYGDLGPVSILVKTSYHNITLTSQWARWHLTSPASRLFIQPFIQAQSKKTSKLRATGLCRRIIRWPVNSPHKWPIMRKNASIWWRHNGSREIPESPLGDLITDDKSKLVQVMVWFRPAASHYPSQCCQIYVTILRHNVLSNCHNINGDSRITEPFMRRNHWW